MRYGIQFDFDCEGEPPKVFICDLDRPFGSEVIEVFEAPTIDGDWSWDASMWEPGPLALRVLDLLNGEER